MENFRLNKKLYDVCIVGDKDLVIDLIEKENPDFNYGLWGACHGGHREIAELMIKKGANYFNWGLLNACEGGHREMVLLLIEKGANNFNWGLRITCLCKHRDIILLLIEKGATNFNNYEIGKQMKKRLNNFPKFVKYKLLIKTLACVVIQKTFKKWLYNPDNNIGFIKKMRKGNWN